MEGFEVLSTEKLQALREGYLVAIKNMQNDLQFLEAELANRSV